ncbi:aminoglycoside phosphotransferase family protein [Agromyces atrinae]|uniref:Streptomycin 6-kinase n=1 Tax=Agromyces atrinae TaxID=592376 RepID=A0A852S3G3_9MICO|nr:aminoglycoside phosphotransferase family protein [Agromyces atrinae]NYD66962.1 streptomycin 6-kinase [Agromyces atrinae]
MTLPDDDRDALARVQRRWGLDVDGDAFRTASSILAPVNADGVLAMLKIALVSEERRGSELMTWLAGRGTARVLRAEGEAILLERAVGRDSLSAMTRRGADDRAILLAVASVAPVHAAEPVGAPVVPLSMWFRALLGGADDLGTFHRLGRDTAAELLADTREPHLQHVLHGDLHHSNVLDFGERGWRLIDPKGLLGERAFDFANLLCNPTPVEALPLVERRLRLIAAAASLDETRLTRWAVAWCALSSCWDRQDGSDERAIEVEAIGAAAASLL